MHSGTRKRVLSGMRSTGKLHLGNYVGALQNWVRMQDEYECFFFIADWHALTTDYADTSRIKENSVEVLLDWLAAGLDPDRCTMFIQSHVPQHAELHLLFSMITPLGWLERVPTYKEQRENIKDKDLGTYGFLGYPVLQAADILMYKADFVPVGEDQVAHVELTREIARRFNSFYRPPFVIRRHGTQVLTSDGRKVKLEPGVELDPRADYVIHPDPVFPEPQSLLTPAAKLPGTDGRKMSKSYGNTIMLTDPEPVIREKMRTMVNDPRRARREDPGVPDDCPVGGLHKIFSDPRVLRDVMAGCTTASISCIECKTWCADALVNTLTPMQVRRRFYEQDPTRALQILKDGSAKARRVAGKTMRQVREVMGLLGTGTSPSRPAMPKVPRDTGVFADENIWELQGIVFGDAMRELWRTSLPPNIVLKTEIGSRRFLTESRKRVGLASTHENPPDHWQFRPLDRTNEILVLLGLSQKDFKLVTFVLPQKILQPNWKKFRRGPRLQEDKKGQVVILDIYRRGSEFLLDVPGEAPLTVTEFRENYEPLW
jgi:tryptophanyl-tRNA synthetase